MFYRRKKTVRGEEQDEFASYSLYGDEGDDAGWMGDRTWVKEADEGVWDDVTYDTDAIVVSRNGQSTLPTTGFGAALKDDDEPVEPPKDAKGNVLTRDDITATLATLRQSRLNIDNDVQRIDDPEEQALTALTLAKRYDDLEKEMKEALRDLDRYEAASLAEHGAREYEMGSLEDNQVITKMVDEEVEWFDNELQALKERVAARVQKRLDALRAEGKTISVETRDRIYDSLAKAEIMEAWEPMEF